MFTPTENRLGIQPINQSSSVQNHDLGTLLRARDPVYGEGEFIYLLGVIGTAIGSLVNWEGQSTGNPTYQTALLGTTGFTGQPIAVSMSANVAGQYGWYQVGGQAVCATNGTVTANNPVYAAGGGQLTTAVASGLQIEEAVSITASGVPSSGFAVVEIDRPFVQGAAVTVANIRKPTSAATITILSSDIEVGIDTRTTAVTANLPSAVAWAAANPTGLDLTLVDYYGNAATNNITPSAHVGDSIDWGGVTPTINANFGNLRLRPDTSLPGWYVRGLN